MTESVAVAKEADAKKGVSSTNRDNSIHRVRNEPERQLGSLRGVIGNIRRDGGRPSVENIATELSGMPIGGRAPVLLALQQTHGNRYVQRVVAGIQAKLKIGQPGDIYEQEADRVADAVMRMPEPQVQRQGMEEEMKEEELIQTKSLSDQITPLMQRQPIEEEEEETIQPKEASTKSPPTRPDIETNIQSSRRGRTPLPKSTRAFFEPRFGHDFNKVKLHTNTRAAELAGTEITPLMQRQENLGGEKEEELIQAKIAGGVTPEVTPAISSGIQSLQGSGRALSRSERSFFEPRFGADFSNVRIHNNDTPATSVARSVNARAFTIGHNVVFGAGEYSSDSLAGKKLLAHELTHVMQQGAGALRQIQRTSTIPFEERADDTCTVTLERFIELVEGEEDRYPVSEQTNTRLMITRLRKIFYGKEGWDEYLISGASHVARPYTTSETDRDRFDVPIPYAPDVTVTASDYAVTDPTTGATPEIARSQEVRLPDGTCIDLGHVFAGLDAMNYPQMVDGPGTINITSNVDAVTWVGDLGSVQAELQFEFIRGGSTDLTSAQWQTIIDEYAPARDMLGNIDAYIIGGAYDVAAQVGGKKVSEILQEYYLSARGTTGGDARAHRYSTFAGAIGLINWNGSNFSNESSWLDDYADEVNDAAALYVGANTRGWWNPARYGAALGMASNANSRLILQKFLAELKLRIAAEPP